MYTNVRVPDSVTRNEDYAKRAVELEHKIISTMEHGFQGRYIEGYELANKYNLKFLFGVEAYWVKNRLEKDDTNAHICIFAQNENGRQCINDILAEANISGFYYQPRIDLDLIFSLPKDDVWVTSACLAFWKYKDDEIIRQLHNYFKGNFFLEVQYHNTNTQYTLNKHIINLANQYNIPIIMGCDSHYISQDKAWERDEYIKSKNIKYEDEQGWFMDYPDGDTAYQRFVDQGALTKAQIEEAIENTNVFLNVQEYNNPCFNHDIKMPTLYPHLSQEEKDKLYTNLIWEKWNEKKVKIPKEKHSVYESEIQKEINDVIITKHADYFLLDYEIVKKAKEKGGLITDTGRGCFTESALIHTKNIIKQIKDIEVGDEVISADGTFNKVLNKFCYDIEEELIQIKHMYGTDKYYPTICTLDHKILINRNNKNYWIQAKDIAKGDYVCVPKVKYKNTSEEYIDLVDYNDFGYEYDDEFIYEYRPCKNNQYKYSPVQIAKELKIGKSTVEKFANGDKNAFLRKKHVLEKFFNTYPFKTQEEYVAYVKNKRTIKVKRYIKNDKTFNIFIGLMYGDGFNSNNNDVSIGLAINSNNFKDKENKKIFYEIAKRLNLDVYEVKAKGKNLSQLYIYSNVFRNFVTKELFLSNIKTEKQFNPKLFNQNKENLQGIIEGLRLSDGSYCEQYDRISFDNTSKSIINAYKILCLMTGEGVNSLTVRPSYTHKDNDSWICKESYKLRINPNAKSAKKISERIKEDDKFWYLPVKEIIKLPKQKIKVYDIEVENQHNYLINNMIVHNSGVSYYTNNLLGFTKIDRISAKVKMYPERFISPTRILESKSLADLDLNTANPEIFAEAQTEVFVDTYGEIGKEFSYPMIAYGTMKAKSAWKMYARAKNIDFALANAVSEQIEKYETALKHAEEDEKDEIDLFDYVDEQYHDILKDSENYLGIISDIKPHPCAYLIYQGNIRKEIGLIKIKAKNGKKEMLCTIMDGKWAEEYKFLKNDLLKVNVVELIKKVYQRIGIEPHDESELLELCKNNQKVWDVYKKGWTIGINQVEQNATKHRAMKYQPKNISELCAFVAAIRPGFKSMYNIFENREPFSYNIPTFDKLIQTEEMPNSFLLYQEMAMAALNFAGIPMSECYEVIKNIAKKRAEKVKKYKDQFIAGFKERLIETENKNETEAQEVAEKVWQIINDSCRYSFNASHSYSVAMDSLYGAYLKSHYPLQFYEVFLNILDAKGNQKDRMAEARKEAEQAYKIRFAPLRFRQDNRKITVDEATNTMWNSLKALKGFGDGLAKKLYELRNNRYDTFVDFLVDLEEKGIMCSKIEDLIKIQYFDEFGNNGKLLKIYKEFTDGTNKYNKKHKEETKIKRIAALKELEKSLPNDKIPIKEQMKFENEILGYVQLTYNVNKRYVYIMDIDTKFSPRAEVYCIANGKTEVMKINKRIFENKPLEKGDIIYINVCKAKPQKRFEDGKFIDIPDSKEWWIEDYDIKNSEFL